MKSKKKIIGIILIIVVLLILLIGIVYAKTDLFKSPKDLFYKYATFNIGKDLDYTKFLKELNEYNEKPYLSTTTYNFNIQSTDLTMNQYFAYYNSITSEVRQKVLPEENKANTNIKLNQNGLTLLQLDILNNDNLYALKTDALHDKYLAIENSNLKELATKLGMNSSEIPNEIPEYNIYEILYINSADINTLVNTYKEIIDRNITEDKYTVQKNINTEVNGTTVQVNAYMLKLTNKELLTTYMDILENMQNDTLLLSILEEKLKLTNSEITQQQIKESITNLLENAKEQLENTEEQEITITAYAKDGKTAKLECVYAEGKLIIENFDVNKDNYTKIAIEAEDEEQISFMIKYNYQNDSSIEAMNIEITCNDSNSLEGLTFNLHSEVNKDEPEKNNTTMTFSFKIDDITYQIKSDTQIDYSAEVNIDDLTEENSIKLNDMTQEELSTLFEEILNNLANKFPMFFQMNSTTMM